MDLKLEGLKVLISGGSKGIGRAALDIFAEEGAIVSFCARNSEEVKSAEQAANGLGSGRVHGTAVDVGDAEALKAWVNDAASAMGGIDIVVANVSALAIPNTPENWETCFNIDLMHTVRMIEGAMPSLEKSEQASIVTVSSVSGREVDFASGPYGTMKTAIIAYTQGLANQLAGQGIRANSVSPGNTYFPGGVWESIEGGNPDLYNMALGMNPTGRMGTPREMATAIVFLASPVSSFTTGANLVVDGALTKGLHV
jgi:3-oxoacyl-[acyl-carrier protein] reductase